MAQVILSTIGTSLLTQQIDRSNPDEKDWYAELRDTANLSLEKVPPNIAKIIDTLKNRALKKLQKGSIVQIRAASAELNGIYGLYEGQLGSGQQDMHWLIATDTGQGQVTAEIVEEFLRSHQITAQIYQPKGLSMASSHCFRDGIDDLLRNLNGLVEGYDKVCFNLVGGFKSLQGYMNTIGMFYADEIIYIFEGADSALIKIPRLPIAIDKTVIQPYVVQFALMAAGAEVECSQLQGLQETLIYVVDAQATLSEWGQLLWNQAKSKLLSDQLLAFPYLTYEPSFTKDYQANQSERDRMKLQETLAKVSALLLKSGGDLTVLRSNKSINLYPYTNTKVKIEHFRVTEELRVTCTPNVNGLSLRYYGTHDHVESKENVR